MAKETVNFAWEYTDTFAGEANYAWVRRGIVRVPSAITRGANTYSAKLIKAAAGLTGVRGRSSWNGSDSYEFRPYNSCTVLFANFTEQSEETESE